MFALGAARTSAYAPAFHLGSIFGKQALTCYIATLLRSAAI